MSRLHGSLASLFSKLLEISKECFSVFIGKKKKTCISGLTQFRVTSSRVKGQLGIRMQLWHFNKNKDTEVWLYQLLFPL